jgi:uncharacterized glyoxalase superfamily protein PhnB
MIHNRSVAADIMLSHIEYQNLPDAISWLTQAFGWEEQYRYGDPVAGAQMMLGKACIMVRQAEPHQKSPAQLGYGTQSLTIFIEDVDALFEKAKAAGAKVREAPHETEYGEYQCAFEDLDGHHWLFSRHARDVRPEDWGAAVAKDAVGGRS